MRFHFYAAAVIGAALSSAASAAELPNEAPDGKRWMSCFIRLMDTGRGYDRPIAVGGYWLVDVPADARKETEDRLRAAWLDEYVDRISSEFPGFVAEMNKGSVSDARCTSYTTRSQWGHMVAHVKKPVTSTDVLRSDYVPTFAHGWVSTREHARGYDGKVGSSGGVVAEAAAEEDEPKRASRKAEPSPTKDARQAAADAEKERIAAREKREAEWRAKEEEYYKDVSAWKSKIAAQEAEEARKQAEHEAAQEAAARVKAAYETKKAAHRRELDAANRRQQEYFAAQRRHALCVNGDQQACADIKAGKPAMGEQLADAGEASTDTDARTCVSAPVVSGNATFEGNTAATVVNGCETAVDVRICLMREGGWNCGVTWGLRPQDRWSHSSFKASGELYWDARVSGSGQPLGSPGGN